LGNLLRLRDEWLAALGLAYLAGASGLIGLTVGVPVILGAPLGALAGAVIKAFGRFRGNTIYALMVVAGWGATMLVAANSSVGSVMGHALVEGQLYFSGTIHLAAAVSVAALSAIALPLVSPGLIRARLLPGHHISKRKTSWPPWAAFSIARNWRHCQLISVGIGVVTYVVSFAIALALDQPFGPVLVAVLVATTGTVVLVRNY
jgi:zinc transport system permease protein